jgi:cobalt/nickel transport system permease protein
VLRRLLILSPFVAGTALAAQYSATGVDWKILALRSTLCLLTIIAFAETTAVSDLLRGLRLIRVPTLLVTTLALMHRYLFVLADESSRMNRARAARTFTTGRRLAWLQAASVAGQLFVRATERAERVYDAMCARGWKT